MSLLNPFSWFGSESDTSDTDDPINEIVLADFEDGEPSETYWKVEKLRGDWKALKVTHPESGRVYQLWEDGEVEQVVR